MKYFDTFLKIAYKYGRFGQNNYYHRLWKFAQSAKNLVTLIASSLSHVPSLFSHTMFYLSLPLVTR